MVSLAEAQTVIIVRVMHNSLNMLRCMALLSVIISPTISARILGVVPVPSYSHQIAFRPLWRELSLRGHEVTVITTNPMNNSSLTNLTEIDINFAYKIWDKFSCVNISRDGMLNSMINSIEPITGVLDEIFQQPDVKRLIKNESEHFDLLMVECFHPAMYAFAERFKCPFIGMMSIDGASDIYEAMGNPTHPILYPDYMMPYSGEMTFLGRLTNVLYYLIAKYAYTLPLYRSQLSSIRKHFGEDYPSLHEIFKNVSMLFVNTDHIFHEIRPHLPSVVQFGGGTHLSPPTPLPKDLQRALDNATQGFIYFCLGSIVKSNELAENTRKVILETLSELPYLVLWKFEFEDLPGKPDNVIISKWFPQQNILRHPNIKLFITHGGQQSMEEAVYTHVPLVGMPFIFDQPANVKKFVSKGFGLSVDYKVLDKNSFKSAILEVITNPKYRNRIKELAELAKDEPMTGLDRAIWWTEYVLRHKGAQHLRSPAAGLPLYQYFLLDVIGFCLLVVAIAIYLMGIIIKFVIKIARFFKPTQKVKVQ